MSQVLVPEEDAAVRSFVAQVLSGAGYVVTVVADGEAALAALLQMPLLFVTAVLDQVMPGLNGTEVVERLRAVHPAFPVLLLSGGWPPPLDTHTRFLAKPFLSDALVREVNRLTVPPTDS